MVDKIKIRRQGWRRSHHKNGRGKDPKEEEKKGSSWEIPQRKISRKTKKKMDCIADHTNARLK